MKAVQIFDQKSKEYDNWFDEHPILFKSDLKALKKAVPGEKFGVEIGVGSGRFAEELAIDRGLDPAENMIRLAESRGIKATAGKTENIPFGENTFDLAVMITVDCFLDNIPKAFREVSRILRPGGEFIIGMIDKNSRLGKLYEKKKQKNPFYREAVFHSPEEITEHLKDVGFGEFEYWQTLISASKTEPEEPKTGYGKGGFIVIRSVTKK